MTSVFSQICCCCKKKPESEPEVVDSELQTIFSDGTEVRANTQLPQSDPTQTVTEERKDEDEVEPADPEGKQAQV